MSKLARAALLLALTGVLGMGCDRNVAPFDPNERPSQPDLGRIFPAPEGDSPQMAARSGSAGPAAGADVGTGRSGAAVRGTVHLAEGDAPPGDSTLFIIARRAGAAGGPPLAVVRVPGPSFPFDYEIGPDDVMIPTMQFEGAIELTARLDRDGNASTRDEGDRETRAPMPVAPGAVGVDLRLE